MAVTTFEAPSSMLAINEEPLCFLIVHCRVPCIVVTALVSGRLGSPLGRGNTHETYNYVQLCVWYTQTTETGTVDVKDTLKAREKVVGFLSFHSSKQTTQVESTVPES